MTAFSDTSAPRLVSQPTYLRFDIATDPEAESRLKELLQAYSKNTLVIILTRPEDAYLNSDALLQGRFSLSQSAFASLCSRLLPGLAQAAHNLAGSRLSDEQLSVSKTHSLPMAVDWINSLITLRFLRIRNYSLIVDTEKQIVEGFVGRKYAYLPNLDLYQKATDFVSAAKRKSKFCEAVLSGRRLMLRYKDVKPLFTITKKAGIEEPFYSGFHFSNSESGDCSIKASSVLIRDWGNTKAVSDFADGSKIAHVKGKQFENRFTELLERLRFKSDDIVKHKANIQRLMATSLNLGGTAERHEKSVRAIERKLLSKGLPADFVQGVVKHALVNGSYKNDTVTSKQEPMEVFAKRTLFDLYNAIGHRAKFLVVDDQELAEQIAYKLLTNELYV